MTARLGWSKGWEGSREPQAEAAMVFIMMNGGQLLAFQPGHFLQNRSRSGPFSQIRAQDKVTSSEDKP